MQKPNVLFISSWYPSKEHPTLGNFVQRHAEAIHPFVNLYVVYVTSSQSIEQDYEIDNQIIDGVNTTIVYYKKVNSKLPFYNSLTKLKKYKKGYELGIEEVMKKDSVASFDLCHCNVTFPAGLVALDLKKKWNLPFVLTEHWTLFLPYKEDWQKLPFYVKSKMKSIVQESEKVVPVSHHLGKSMQQKGLEGNYTIIPNVVDTNRFSLGKSKLDSVKKILHVSTLVNAHKNIEGIFQTLKNITQYREDFKLIIVSDGNIEEAKKIQHNLYLEDKFVEYHGTKTPDEIVQFYQEADFFLLFSKYENLPVVISESLCCGLPVVSSSVGGIPEMIDENNGLIVPPSDEKKLEEAINQLLDNVAAYSKEKIREEAVALYENKVVGNQYLTLYNEILK